MFIVGIDGAEKSNCSISCPSTHEVLGSCRKEHFGSIQDEHPDFSLLFRVFPWHDPISKQFV